MLWTGKAGGLRKSHRYQEKKVTEDLRAAASLGLQRAAEDEAVMLTSSVREAPSQKMKAVRPQAQAPYIRRQIKDRGELGSGA